MTYPKNKYRKGYIIFGMDSLIYDHLEKDRWVYLRDKVMNPSIILNMTVKTVRGFMDKKLICEAVDQQKEYYAKMQEEYLAKAKVPCSTNPKP